MGTRMLMDERGSHTRGCWDEDEQEEHKQSTGSVVLYSNHTNSIVAEKDATRPTLSFDH